MLLNILFQDGNQVKAPPLGAAVIHEHLTGRLSVLAHDHAGGKSVAGHVFIVTYIVLGHDKGLFAFRQEDLLSGHLGSLLGGDQLRHVMEAHQDKTSLIHGIQDL